jgi:hypothetical protein
VELDPVEELRAVRMQVAAREAGWDAAMSEQRARVDQLDLEVRGKSELVTRMAERMPSMETLETSIANLVNVCEADMEKHARGISDMQILLDNQSEAVDKHSKILTAVEANVKRIQGQVLQLQKQLGTAISTFESQASVMSDQGTPLRPVSPRSRSSTPMRGPSPPKPPGWRASPQVRRAVASDSTTTPDSLSGPSEWLPVDGSRIPRSRREETPSP